jgi:hypothetical protein
MKAQYFKTILLSTIILAAGSFLKAQTLREENQKDFNTQSTSSLKLENQFGNVTVTDWDQNKVSVVYIVEVTATPESKAKKLMEEIQIEFKEEGGLISIKTKIGKDGSLNLKTDRGEKQSFKIDYFVKCPRNIPVELSNHFGDVSVSTLTGKVDLDVQFGSLNAVALKGTNNIKLQFGQATLGDLGKTVLSVQHSDLAKIQSVESLNIEASFSTLNFGKVGVFDGEITSGSTSIDQLTGSMTLEASMGSIEVKNVAAGFSTIEIKQDMGDIELQIDPKAGYKLDAKASMGSIDVPKGFKSEESSKETIPGLENAKVKGVVGNGSGSINIKMNMGSLKIS